MDDGKKRFFDPDTLCEGSKNRSSHSPDSDCFIPPDVLELLLQDGLTEEEVKLHLERLRWRRVGHLSVAK